MSVTEDFVEFYFVDPKRLAAGFNPIKISYPKLAILIKYQVFVTCDGQTIGVPHFYW